MPSVAALRKSRNREDISDPAAPMRTRPRLPVLSTLETPHAQPSSGSFDAGRLLLTSRDQADHDCARDQAHAPRCRARCGRPRKGERLMPSFVDATGRLFFVFDRTLPGHGRVRVKRPLPQSWTRDQANAYAELEAARIADAACGGRRGVPFAGVVCSYLKTIEGKPSHRRLAQNLAAVTWACAGRTLAELPDVLAAVKQNAEQIELAGSTLRDRLGALQAAARYARRVLSQSSARPAPGVEH